MGIAEEIDANLTTVERMKLTRSNIIKILAAASFYLGVMIFMWMVIE